MARNVKFLTADIRKAVSKGGQMASVKISNSLSSAGPLWTGKFSSAWHSIPGEKSIKGGARQQRGTKYRYSPSDVKTKIVPKIATKKGSNYSLYRIVNTLDYADQATDQQPFNPTGIIPKILNENNIVARGERKVYRGEIKVGKGNNVSTAPLDWYTTYASAKLQKDVQVGFSAGLSMVSNSPATKI